MKIPELSIACSVIRNWAWSHGMKRDNKVDNNKMGLDQNFLSINHAKNIVKKLCSFTWSCTYDTDIEWHTKDNMNQHQKMGKRTWMVDKNSSQ